MLPFKNRLVKRRDFENIQKRGMFFSQGNIAVKFVENGTRDSRVGFSVGLKYSKLSVARSNAKRMLREIFRSKVKQLKRGLDIDVIIRKKDNEKIVLKKIHQDVDDVLVKSGLITNK